MKTNKITHRSPTNPYQAGRSGIGESDSSAVEDEIDAHYGRELDAVVNQRDGNIIESDSETNYVHLVSFAGGGRSGPTAG